MMNKKLWVGAYLVSLMILVTALLIGGVLSALLYDEMLRIETFGVPMVALGALAYLQFIIVHTIITLSVLYKLWAAIQDGITPVSPGKAIGFLFIPFYNIYWVFRVWSGYPTEYNAFIDRYRLGAPRLSGALFTAFPILILLTAIFVVPILAIPFVAIFLIARACDAVNNMTLARLAAQEGRPLIPAAFIGTPENPRSRMPVYALMGVLAFSGVLLLGFSVFAWSNLSPTPSADIAPQKVGEYELQPGGFSRGSILGRRQNFLRLYVASTAAGKKAIDYNVVVDPDDTTSKQRLSTMCSNPSDGIKDPAGVEVGRLCSLSGSRLFVQIGNKTMRIDEPESYDLKRLGAKAATADERLAFAKSIPINSGLTFPATQSGTTLASTSSNSPSGSSISSSPVAIGATPDFTFSGEEFYKATNGKDKASLSKYDGKIIQVTARLTSPGSDFVMMQAGTDSFFANSEGADTGAFAEAKPDDRLVLKCRAKADSSLRLEQCILIENKKRVTPQDPPDVTFTADGYWDAVASYKLPASVRHQKWDELRGKIVKVTGKVKDTTGETIDLAAGDNSISCKSDDASAISGLSPGQQVTLFSVHGVTSLEHCIVVAK